MNHINQEQRYTIQVLLEQDFSKSDIATVIGKNKTSIYRELKRNSDKRNSKYTADLATKKCNNQLKQKIMKTLKKWALVATTVLAMSCTKDDPTPVPPTPQSSAKTLTGLQFTQVNNPNLTASYTAVIDEVTKTAKVTFPYGTNVSALKPSFTVSDKATLKIGNDVQTSNSSV